MGSTSDKATATKERRSSSRELIKKLTTERTEVLVLYCQVAGLDIYGNSTPERKAKAEPVGAILERFCQVLVDYIAAGHFSLYERIVNGKERRREAAALAERLYPQIAETTEIALDFNDKYDCGDHCVLTDDFEDDLSRLGHAMAERIDLEDQLLKTLL